MKQITPQQIEAIITSFYQANAPVQMFEQVKNLLASLPDVDKKNEL